MQSEFGNYLHDTDTKALARIDEILARSRKVVEENIELSKKNIEHKPKIEILIETPKSTENSGSSYRKVKIRASECSLEADLENFAETSQEK